MTFPDDMDKKIIEINMRKEKMMKKIRCDVCGREISPKANEGLITYDVEYDEKGIKHLSNFNIHHKSYINGRMCDYGFERSASHILDEAVGIDGLAYWLDLLDPKYNHGENNREAQFTVIDLSCIETMYRCLLPGYDEARHYALDYGHAMGDSREPMITKESIKNILAWAKKVQE